MRDWPNQSRVREEEEIISCEYQNAFVAGDAFARRPGQHADRYYRQGYLYVDSDERRRSVGQPEHIFSKQVLK